MERASTAAVPSYAPMDAHDLHVALTEIDHRLEGLYPGRFTARALMGYSMGGFHSLFIAATNEASLIKFDRYVAINSPVRLMYAVSQLDEFFQAPLAWPSDERTENIENTFLKVAGLSKTSLTPHGSLPFSAIESRFLIGVAFRLILRDVIFSSQRRNNQGVLEQPINRLRREPVYREILQYSFKDYLDRFVTPYYQTRDIDLTAPQTLTGGEDLRTRTGALQANPKIRLIVNRNDILLADEDLAWLETAIGPERLTIFEKGGHLGNLAHPAVQKAIVRALEGLGEVIGNQ
jgi:pimeloyl-ACP methyl ester carboxylesterase